MQIIVVDSCILRRKSQLLVSEGLHMFATHDPIILRDKGLTRIQEDGPVVALCGTTSSHPLASRIPRPLAYASRPSPVGIYARRATDRRGRHRHSCRDGDPEVSVDEGQGVSRRADG